MSDDLIKRSDAIKAYNEAMDELVKWQMEEWQLGDFSECEFNTTDCKHIVRKLEAIPSADRPQGEWIYGEHDVAMCDGYRCDKCGFFVPWDYEHKFIDFINDYHFCPNCGADMRGEDDES